LVFEEARFINAVRDGHDIDTAKLRPAFAPVTMRQDMMTTNLTACFNLPTRRHRPMKKRVESRYPHPSDTRFHVFQKRGKAPNDFAGVQLFSHAIKFFDGNGSFARAC